MSQEAQYAEENGIVIPSRRPCHRDNEYDERGFDVLIRIQREHFWYKGRHKLLLNVLKREIADHFCDNRGLRAIDMGGGCGGWLEYLHTYEPGMFRHLALGDSSMRALELAEPVVSSFATRYQVDLLDLPWKNEWDVVFLLDVVEHIPGHEEALRQIRESMRPGGLLFVTVPALRFFWTYNDDLARHQRRYNRQDLQALGASANLELLRTDYFMFLLSPALWLSRVLFRPPTQATPEQIREHAQRAHRIPGQPVNAVLASIVSLEAALVNHIGFPWGTSILAVFRRGLA